MACACKKTKQAGQVTAVKQVVKKTTQKASNVARKTTPIRHVTYKRPI